MIFSNKKRLNCPDLAPIKYLNIKWKTGLCRKPRKENSLITADGLENKHQDINTRLTTTLYALKHLQQDISLKRMKTEIQFAMKPPLNLRRQRILHQVHIITSKLSPIPICPRKNSWSLKRLERVSLVRNPSLTFFIRSSCQGKEPCSRHR